MSIEIGTVAPDFTLKNQHGEDIALSSLRGSKKVLLMFFPFAFSGICTGELCEIRDTLPDLTADDVEVLAVSCDHFFSNRAFADAEGYAFSILSDFWPHGAVSKAYGVFEDGVGAARRGTFVIDLDGTVRWKVDHPIGEARDLGEYREALAQLG